MITDNNRYDEIPLLIAKQLVGTISDEERLELEAWRRQSVFNEETFQRLMDRKRLTIEQERHTLSDYERPLAEMKRRLRPRMRRHWMAAAAVALLLIGGAGLLWINRHPSPTEQLVAQAEIHPGYTKATLTRANGEVVELTSDAEFGKPNTLPKERHGQGQSGAETVTSFNNLSTPRGGEFKIVLEDGTEVWLNAETTLRYPETFTADERRVEVSGEAYFKVAKDAGRPFYVVSGGQEVRVYGTEFNVNGYADEADIRTTLVEGSISLRVLNGNGSELMLSPGNQAVFDKQEARARVQQVDTDVVTSWRSGTFVFEDQTMEQIMHTLSRWYDFQYEFTSPDLAKTVFMGSIPRYGSFSEVAQIFEKMGGIHLRQKSDKVIISEK